MNKANRLMLVVTIILLGLLMSFGFIKNKGELHVQEMINSNFTLVKDVHENSASLDEFKSTLGSNDSQKNTSVKFIENLKILNIGNDGSVSIYDEKMSSVFKFETSVWNFIIFSSTFKTPVIVDFTSYGQILGFVDTKYQIKVLIVPDGTFN